MNRRLALLFGLILVLIVGAWYLLLWSPAGDDLADAEQRLAAARAEQQQL
jgi:type II secretory pathway component PulM